jgi:hypothetical protein
VRIDPRRVLREAVESFKVGGRAALDD